MADHGGGFKKLMEDESDHDGAVPMSSGPSVYISTDELEEMRDWEVGSHYLLLVRQTSRTVREEEDGDGPEVSGHFEVVSAKPEPVNKEGEEK